MPRKRHDWRLPTRRRRQPHTAESADLYLLAIVVGEAVEDDRHGHADRVLTHPHRQTGSALPRGHRPATVTTRQLYGRLVEESTHCGNSLGVKCDLVLVIVNDRHQRLACLAAILSTVTSSSTFFPSIS